MLNVVLIRHGATAGNVRHCYIGRTEEHLLPAAEAELLKRRNQHVYPEVDCLYGSPMIRCKETAQLLYPNQTMIEIADFRECDFGAFEGKNYQELSGNADYQQWIDSQGTIVFPGGELPEAFKKRCITAFEQVLQSEELLRALEQNRKSKRDCTVGMVVHGGTIMAIMERFAQPQRSYYEWQCGNGEGYVLELGDCNSDLGIKGTLLHCVRHST